MRSYREQIDYLKDLSSILGAPQAMRFRAAQLMRLPRIQVALDAKTKLAVRPRTTDLQVAHATFSGEFDALKEHIDASFDGLVIDAGGYIGTAALCLARLFPKATVVTVEPSSANFEILSRNIVAAPPIHAIKAALAAKGGGTLRLMDRNAGNWGFSVVDSSADSNASRFIEEVQTVSIADIVARFPDKPLGILKLDIEGAEKALFRDAADQLADIPLIFAELHDFFMSGCEEAFRGFAPERKIRNFGGEKFLSIAAAGA